MKGYKKIKLHGFNNLTKTLSFNIYDICYTRTTEDRIKYIEYIDEQYNSERLTNILQDVTKMIGAHVLNVAKQDYDPQGASVTILISEEEVPDEAVDSSCNKGVLVNVPQHVVGHLDKSHLTVHTYPEYHPENGISTFRVDIDVSTCGQISPLKALNYLIDSFDSDIITADYRVRGFTRDATGQKLFIDHNINSIQNYIAKRTLNKYQLIDVNVYQENIFHTKMMLKDFELNNYLFAVSKDDLPPKDQREIMTKLKKEMAEIYYGRNIGKL